VTSPGPHPPAPWRLGGPSLVVPALVPIVSARDAIPDSLHVLPVAPGYTLGGLVAVTYEPGSTLSYNELIACAGMVRSGRHVGGWISHIWVDDQESVNGGRGIWKLPKDLAEFRTDRRPDGSQRFSAHVDGTTLVRIASAPPRFTTPSAGLVPMISATDGGAQAWFTLGRSTLKAGPARTKVEIPAESPLAGLGLKPSPVASSGHANLVMDAATPLQEAVRAGKRSSPE
jgi:acetoacetate decarboxylase